MCEHPEWYHSPSSKWESQGLWAAAHLGQGWKKAPVIQEMDWESGGLGSVPCEATDPECDLVQGTYGMFTLLKKIKSSMLTLKVWVS